MTPDDEFNMWLPDTPMTARPVERPKPAGLFELPSRTFRAAAVAVMLLKERLKAMRP